jgi:hypothetical protein
MLNQIDESEFPTPRVINAQSSKGCARHMGVGGVRDLKAKVLP